jgi:hypothetical protein
MRRNGLRSTKLGIAIAAAAAFAVSLIATSSAAAFTDTNGDRIPDRWEKRHHLSLKVDQRRRDQDHDGLRNRREWRHHGNPRDADTDDDGLNDLQEVQHHTGLRDTDSDDDGLDDGDEIELGDDPLNHDTDGDGTDDGDELAGHVVSYDSGTGALTIALPGGTQVTKNVVAGTEIKCDPNGEGGGDDYDCTAQAATVLVPNAVVHEAEVDVSDPGDWDKIELLV